MDQTLFLQPLASHRMSDSNPKGNHHLVFRRSLDNKSMKGAVNELSNSTLYAPDLLPSRLTLILLFSLSY